MNSKSLRVFRNCSDPVARILIERRYLPNEPLVFPVTP
jgi:hypothetical protein